MKKWTLILLLLAGCGAKDTEETEGNALGVPEGLTAPLPAGPPGQDPAALQALIDRAMATTLPNAKDAQYRNLRPGTAGAVCGEVSVPGPKQAPGPFRLFVVTSDAVAIVAEGATIDYDDAEDAFADAWLRWCATPDELQALSTRLQSAADNAAADNAAMAIPEVPLPDLPTDALPQDPEPAAKAKRTEPPPPPQIDSFFNSVDRPKN